MNLVWIPPGQFMMGAADDALDAEHCEQPQHPVSIPDGFRLALVEESIPAIGERPAPR